MDVPDVVREAIGDESVAASVALGGEDVLLVTPTRTVVYRGEGLLSDESVAEYPHDVSRIVVNEGRRKSTVRLDYGPDGEQSLDLPTGRLNDALHPILAGVLSAAGVTRSGETITRTFLFSELTVVVTSDRLVKHVGTAVWDGDYDEYPYDDVTDLAFEEGNHATGIVIGLGERRERFKTPNDRAEELREALVAAVLDYHGYDDLAAFRADRAGENGELDDEGEASDAAFGGSGLAPLGAGAANDGLASDGADDRAAGTEDGSSAAAGAVGAAAGTADDDGESVAAELAALREAVETQNERIERQADLVEQLIEELRRGR